MGSRGPQPTPTQTLIDRNSRKLYGRKAEPVDPVVAPEMPQGLNPVAAQYWALTVPRLVARRTICELDFGKLVGMCRWWAHYCHHDDALEELELSGKGWEGSSSSHPMKLSHLAWTAYAAIAYEFGLSPSSKTRVQASPAEKAENDKSRFFDSPASASGPG